MNDYIAQQLSRLGVVIEGEPVQIQLHNNNGRTNFIYLTYAQYEAIKEALKDE